MTRALWSDRATAKLRRSVGVLACMTGLACDPATDAAPNASVTALQPSTAPVLSTVSPPNTTELDHSEGLRPSPHTGPRCTADDPTCLPLDNGPYSEWTLEHGYNPALPRNTTTIAERWSDGPGDAPCSHDGDCLRGGCGNHCVHWKTPGFAHTCVVPVELLEARCGCVEQRCRWFTQPRRRLTADLSTVDVEPRLASKDGEHGWEGYALEKDIGWLLTQDNLLRCYKQHLAALPQDLRFTLNVDQTGNIQSATVTGGSAGVRACTQRTLSSVLLRDRRGIWQPRSTGARVSASLSVRIEQLQ